MRGFYALSTGLFLLGLATIYYASASKPPNEFTSTAFFAGACLTIIGAATFTLTFGYHVRYYFEHRST